MKKHLNKLMAGFAIVTSLLLCSILITACTEPLAALTKETELSGGGKGSGSGAGTYVSVVNWNVQTFFDGNNDDIEDYEFKGRAWNEDLYEQRLLRLC